MELLEKVLRSKAPNSVEIRTDELTQLASKSFDYEFNGKSEFYQWEIPKDIPTGFNIGVIVGASGSGKSTLLSRFGQEELVMWDNSKAIVSHFDSIEDAINRLSSVGLNSIPAWVKPYTVLSTGEKFRADLAIRVRENAVIDEFTSVVDRNVAKATSVSISKYIKKNDIRGVVFATCHEDIIPWLEADWIFNANTGELYSGRFLRRPEINIKIFSCERSAWELFKNHHYLSTEISAFCRSYIAIWDDNIVGFASCMTMPSGSLQNAWREHRTVVLPDFQGMGIGTRLSDGIAQIYVDEGKRYFSKTAHPRFGHYRDNSPNWKKTSKYKANRKDLEGRLSYLSGTYHGDHKRICYSHEYIGG